MSHPALKLLRGIINADCNCTDGHPYVRGLLEMLDEKITIEDITNEELTSSSESSEEPNEELTGSESPEELNEELTGSGHLFKSSSGDFIKYDDNCTVNGFDPVLHLNQMCEQERIEIEEERYRLLYEQNFQKYVEMIEEEYVILIDFITYRPEFFEDYYHLQYLDELIKKINDILSSELRKNVIDNITDNNDITDNGFYYMEEDC